MTWASFAASIVGLFNKLAMPFLLAIAFMKGKSAGRAEATSEANKKAAETQTEYAEILARDREPNDAVTRMRAGDY